MPCSGKFLLHQGVQRRIAVTICDETGSDLIWKSVKEVVVGRLRSNRMKKNCHDLNEISLNVISSQYIHKRDDQRSYYRFEASWDSSLHNSLLLNRITPAKDWICMTITCYLDVENFVQPACITKDLNLVFYARDSKISFQRFQSNNTHKILIQLKVIYKLFRSLTNLIYSGTFKSVDSHSVTGLYRMTIIQVAADQSTIKNLLIFFWIISLMIN